MMGCSIMNGIDFVKLDIDIEKLLRDCDNAQIQAEQIADFKAKVMARKAYQKEYRKAHRERYNELNRKYYAAHIEENRKRALERYYAKRGKHIENPIAHTPLTPEEAKQAAIERNRRYREKHRDEIRKKGRDYYNARKNDAEFITHRRALERARYAANRDEYNAKQRAKRAARKAAKAAQQQTENKDT